MDKIFEGLAKNGDVINIKNIESYDSINIIFGDTGSVNGKYVSQNITKDAIESGKIIHLLYSDSMFIDVSFANGKMTIHDNDFENRRLKVISVYGAKYGEDTDIQKEVDKLKAEFDSVLTGVTQDSEILDARVKADGSTAPTLGEAIRGQVTALKEDLTQLNIDVKNITKLQNFDLSSPLTDRKGIYSDGSIYNTTTSSATEKYIDVSLFKTIAIQVDAEYTGNYYIACYDESKTFIKRKVATPYIGSFRFLDVETFFDVNTKYIRYSMPTVAKTSYIINGITALQSAIDDLIVKEVNCGTFEELQNAISNEKITEIHLSANITATDVIEVTGTKNIYGHGYKVTGNSNLHYLFKSTDGYQLFDNIIISEADNDVIYAGAGCNLLIKNCDISKSFSNDGVGLHGDANVYIYNSVIHDCNDEGLSSHDTSYCEVYNTEFYKNGYNVGTDVESGISFGGLHFGGSRMGIAKGCYCHHNSKNGIGFITIDGNYSTSALAIAEGNITLDNVERGIRFGGATNVRCVNNMCSDSILFYQKDGHGNTGYIGHNSAKIAKWSGADDGLIDIDDIING